MRAAAAIREHSDPEDREGDVGREHVHFAQRASPTVECREALGQAPTLHGPLGGPGDHRQPERQRRDPAHRPEPAGTAVDVVDPDWATLSVGTILRHKTAASGSPMR
jgi:hypothetical protein